jgi:hypothetical protein
LNTGVRIFEPTIREDLKLKQAAAGGRVLRRARSIAPAVAVGASWESSARRRGDTGYVGLARHPRRVKPGAVATPLASVTTVAVAFPAKLPPGPLAGAVKVISMDPARSTCALSGTFARYFRTPPIGRQVSLSSAGLEVVFNTVPTT